MMEVKKKINQISNDLEQQYRRNTMAYKGKYLEVVALMNNLYQDTNRYNLEMISIKKGLNLSDEAFSQQRLKDDDLKRTASCKKTKEVGFMQTKTLSIKQLDNLKQNMSFPIKIDGIEGDYIDTQIQPSIIIQFIRDFCQSTLDFCKKIKLLQIHLESQIKSILKNEQMQMENNHEYSKPVGPLRKALILENKRSLTKMQLQNYTLKIQIEELTKQLEIKQLQCAVAEKARQQYKKKFGEYQKDFNGVIVEIASLLKECEQNEIELRQQNRIQKQLMEAHKLEYQKYKADFRLKSNCNQKLERMRQVLEKKFENQKQVLVKQMERIIQKRSR